MKTRLPVCDLTAALARMGSSVELAREMLDLFREDATIYQSRLASAVTAGDAETVEHASHSLRGMLSMFGAESAMQVAQSLEEMGREGTLADAPAQNEKLDGEISRFLQTATQELEKL